MTNTTDIYWEADGESLHTWAWNISTLGGMGVPPLRGSDNTVPYRVGQRWNPKVPDSRILPLAMWVVGSNADGSAPSGGNARRDLFQANWRNLRALLYTPGRQFELTKRFFVDGVLRSATALAEYNGGLEPTMFGPRGAKMTVNLKLADPFFYDDAEQTFNLVNGDQVVNVQGDSISTHIVATINGPRNKPKLRVKVPLDTQFEYDGDISTDDDVVVNVQEFSSRTTPDGVPTYISDGRIINTGAPEWMRLSPGNNTVNLTSLSGAGSVQLKVRGAWL